MADRPSVTGFALATFVAAIISAPVQAAESPVDLARTMDPPVINSDAAIDPWGAAANRPVIEETEKPAVAPVEQTLTPIPIQPVQDRLVEKLVHWVMLRDKDRDQSFEELTTFIIANPGWPKTNSLVRKTERAIDDSTPTRAMLDWFENHAPRTLEGSIASSQALFRSDSERKAIDRVRRGWSRFDMSRDE